MVSCLFITTSTVLSAVYNSTGAEHESVNIYTSVQDAALLSHVMEQIIISEEVEEVTPE